MESLYAPTYTEYIRLMVDRIGLGGANQNIHSGGCRMNEHAVVHEPMAYNVMGDGCLLTADELSQRLGVSKSTIYKMSSKGHIPSVSVGMKLGGRRFSERAVREALGQLIQPPRRYHARKERETVAEQVGEMAQ